MKINTNNVMFKWLDFNYDYALYPKTSCDIWFQLMLSIVLVIINWPFLLVKYVFEKFKCEIFANASVLIFSALYIYTYLIIVGVADLDYISIYAYIFPYALIFGIPIVLCVIGYAVSFISKFTIKIKWNFKHGKFSNSNLRAAFNKFKNKHCKPVEYITNK